MAFTYDNTADNTIRSFTLKEWKYLTSVFNIRSGFEGFLPAETDKVIDTDIVYKGNLEFYFPDAGDLSVFKNKDISEYTEYDYGCIDEDLSKVYVPKFFYKNFRRYLNIDGYIGRHFDDIQPDNYNAFANPDCRIQKFYINTEPREEQLPLFEKIDKHLTVSPIIQGIIQAAPGYGKEEPYSEPVLTPTGWTTMGELKVGDYVVDANGFPTKVLEIHEQGFKDVYKISFNDDTEVRCGLNHLWRLYRYGASKDKKWKVTELKDFKDNYLGKPYQDKRYENSNQKARKFAVQLCKPISFEEKTLIIPPYSLGLLLGDGSFRLSGNQISYADKDGTTIHKLINELNEFGINDITYRQTDSDWRILSKTLKQKIIELGLDNKLSIDKHIPKDYLYSSIEHRRLLLAGLLETDSWTDKKGRQHLVTSSKQLKNDMLELCRGLGYHTSFIIRKIPKYSYKGEIKASENEAYDILINETKDKKFIDEIKKLDYQENSRCIVVDNPDHLYITTDYTVTHNTYSSLKISSNVKLRTIIVVPNDVLLNQWKDAIIKFSNFKEEDIGILQGSDPQFLLTECQKEVNLIIINSLYSQIKRLGREFVYSLYKNVGIVFYDETHVSGGAEAFSKTSSVFRTNNIIGLTATPYRKGLNEFLLLNSIGDIFFKSEHQNLIPTVFIQNCHIETDQRKIDSLNFFRNDYIRFLVTYNSMLFENDAYFNYLSDWIAFRVSEGHKVAILFSTNKMIFKMHNVLKFRHKIDSGIIIGETEKSNKIEKPKFSQAMIDQINEVYLSVYPRKKVAPSIKEGKVISEKDYKLIEEINNYRKANNLSLVLIKEPEKQLTELEVAKTKPVTVSNFQSMSAGYDDDMLSCLIFGSVLIGKVGVIQSIGRATRANPDKIQFIPIHCMWSQFMLQYFPDMHWTLMRNIKVQYPTAKFHLENFPEEVKPQANILPGQLPPQPNR